MFTAYDPSACGDKAVSASGICSLCRKRRSTCMRQTKGGGYMAYCSTCKWNVILRQLPTHSRQALQVLLKFPGCSPPSLAARIRPPLKPDETAAAIACLRERGLIDEDRRPCRDTATIPDDLPDARKKVHLWRLFLHGRDDSRQPLPGEFTTRKAAENAARRLYANGPLDGGIALVCRRDDQIAYHTLYSWRRR